LTPETGGSLYVYSDKIHDLVELGRVRSFNQINEPEEDQRKRMYKLLVADMSTLSWPGRSDRNGRPLVTAECSYATEVPVLTKAQLTDLRGRAVELAQLRYSLLEAAVREDTAHRLRVTKKYWDRQELIEHVGRMMEIEHPRHMALADILECPEFELTPQEQILLRYRLLARPSYPNGEHLRRDIKQKFNYWARSSEEIRTPNEIETLFAYRKDKRSMSKLEALREGAVFGRHLPGCRHSEDEFYKHCSCWKHLPQFNVFEQLRLRIQDRWPKVRARYRAEIDRFFGRDIETHSSDLDKRWRELFESKIATAQDTQALNSGELWPELWNNLGQEAMGGVGANVCEPRARLSFKASLSSHMARLEKISPVLYRRRKSATELPPERRERWFVGKDGKRIKPVDPLWSVIVKENQSELPTSGARLPAERDGVEAHEPLEDLLVSVAA
jgi:hypothetical protein